MTLELLEPDPDPGAHEGDQILRAKWTMDGAETLPEAATKLREFAGELDRLHKEGWELDGPIADDYGSLIPPEGLNS